MRSESGSALVQTIAGMTLLLTIALGAIQVALVVYARNSVAAAAHEGARAAMESGQSDSDARAIARSTIDRTAGGALREFDVTARLAVDSDGVGRVVVTVIGELNVVGPVPISFPIHVVGRASGQREVP